MEIQYLKIQKVRILWLSNTATGTKNMACAEPHYQAYSKDWKIGVATNGKYANVAKKALDVLLIKILEREISFREEDRLWHRGRSNAPL